MDLRFCCPSSSDDFCLPRSHLKVTRPSRKTSEQRSSVASARYKEERKSFQTKIFVLISSFLINLQYTNKYIVVGLFCIFPVPKRVVDWAGRALLFDEWGRGRRSLCHR